MVCEYYCRKNKIKFSFTSLQVTALFTPPPPLRQLYSLCWSSTFSDFFCANSTHEIGQIGYEYDLWGCIRVNIQTDLQASKVVFSASPASPNPSIPVFSSHSPSAPPLSPLPITTPLSPVLPPSSLPSLASSISSLLGRFPEVTSPPTTPWPAPRHQTKHFLNTTGPPLFSRSRRLTPEQLCTGSGTRIYKIGTHGYHPPFLGTMGNTFAHGAQT
jgi:hypothetical protein